MLHYAPEDFARAKPLFGDCASPEELIARHSPLVRRLAWHVHSRAGSTSELEELMQIGLIALVEAARGYEDRGHAFSTYASTRVRGAMIDHLRREALSSRSAMAARRKIEDARARVEQRELRAASQQEIAAELGMEIDAYHAFAASAEPVNQGSIDDLYSDHDVSFADDADRADVRLEKAEMREMLARAISELPEREAMILQLYFVEEMNLHEIGQIMHTGAARICQIKKAALAKLRMALSD